jgi:hypothetical protein
MNPNADPLTTDELHTLINAAARESPETEVTMLLLAHCGLRATEAKELLKELSESDTAPLTTSHDEGCSFLTSSSLNREIPLASRTADRLEACRDELREGSMAVSQAAIHQRVTKVGELTGVERVSPRLLRWTWAARFLEQGVTMDMLAWLLGVLPETYLLATYEDDDLEVSPNNWGDYCPLSTDGETQTMADRECGCDPEIVVEDYSSLVVAVEKYLAANASNLQPFTVTRYASILHRFKNWSATRSRSRWNTGSPINLEAEIERYLSECSDELAKPTQRSHREVLERFAVAVQKC